MAKRATMLAIMLAALVLMTAVAAADGYVTVNNGSTKYSSIDEAVAAASAVNGSVTYNIYGTVKATGTNQKYTPDLALNGKADKVYVVGKTDDAKITLNGVYYQRFAAEGADLIAEKVIFADARAKSGEGNDPDPWEFCYLTFETDSAEFKNCTFHEGVQISIDATFTNCLFSLQKQYYSGDDKDYSYDHYLLWVMNYGDVDVNSCVFENGDYGAIKSTWNMYNGNKNDADLTITVKDSLFVDCGKGGEHKMLHLDGAKSVAVSGNTVNNSYGSGTIVKDKSDKAAVTENGTKYNDASVTKEQVLSGKKQETKPTPAPTATPAPDTSNMPQTGDNSNIALFALLLTASAAGMMLLMRRKAAQE